MKRSYRSLFAAAAVCAAMMLTFTACGGNESGDITDESPAVTDAAESEAVQSESTSEASESESKSEAESESEADTEADTNAADVGGHGSVIDSVYYGTGYHFNINDTWKVSDVVPDDVECALQLAKPESEMELATLFAVQALPDANIKTVSEIGEPIVDAYEMMDNFTVLEHGECKVGKYDAYSIVIRTEAAEGINVNMNQMVVAGNGKILSVMITSEESLYSKAMDKAAPLLDSFVIED